MQQPRDTIPIRKLMPLLADPDRLIRFAARVAIEHGDIEKDAAWIMDTQRASPSGRRNAGPGPRVPARRKQQDDVLRRLGELLTSRRPLEPDLTCDLLRLIELTYLLGPLKAEAPASAAITAALARALLHLGRFTGQPRDSLGCWPFSMSPGPWQRSCSIRRPYRTTRLRFTMLIASAR